MEVVQPKCRTFQELASAGFIGRQTLRFVESLGLERTSPIQDAVIPRFAVTGQDVAVEACTGSGKTLAFLIPTVEILLKIVSNEEAREFTRPQCRIGAVILAPTRELAVQIRDVLEGYLRFANEELPVERSQINNNGDDDQEQDSCRAQRSDEEQNGVLASLLLTGGGDINENNIPSIRVAATKPRLLHIIVATPGRLAHLMDTLKTEDVWTFRTVEILVFDEADRLLLDGASFTLQLETILSPLPKQRHTGMFSATLTAEIHSLVKAAGMRNPTLIRATTHLSSNRGDSSSDLPQTSMPQGLSNYYALLPRHHKVAFLFKFLLSEIFPSRKTKLSPCSSLMQRKGKKCIVFFLTCSCVQYFYKVFIELVSQRWCPQLSKRTIIERLYGKMSNTARTKAYQRFSSANRDNGGVLFATDIAARGLDFPDVDWILQFDAPLDPAMYIHRVGRTARAGRSGETLLLLSPQEDACIPFLRNRQIAIDDVSKHTELVERLASSPVDKLIERPVVPQLASSAVSQEGTAPAAACSVAPVITSAEMQTVKTTIDPLSECPDYDSCNHDDLDAATSGDPVFKIATPEFRRSWEVTRALLVQDRDILLKASACVVSVCRGYQEHQLQFIFPFRNLEIGLLASSLGLLRIPRISEILGRKIVGFKQSRIIPTAVVFKDMARGKEYERLLERRKETRLARKRSVPTKLPPEKASTKRRSRSEKKRTKRRLCEQEWEEMALEERTFKKLRKGKISESEYLRLVSKSNRSSEPGATTLSITSDDDNITTLTAQHNRPKWTRPGRGLRKK